jgi:hypothetical protein
MASLLRYFMGGFCFISCDAIPLDGFGYALPRLPLKDDPLKPGRCRAAAKVKGWRRRFLALSNQDFMIPGVSFHFTPGYVLAVPAGTLIEMLVEMLCDGRGGLFFIGEFGEEFG